MIPNIFSSYILCDLNFIHKELNSSVKEEIKQAYHQEIENDYLCHLRSQRYRLRYFRICSCQECFDWCITIQNIKTTSEFTGTCDTAKFLQILFFVISKSCVLIRLSPLSDIIHQEKSTNKIYLPSCTSMQPVPAKFEFTTFIAALRFVYSKQVTGCLFFIVEKF